MQAMEISRTGMDVEWRRLEVIAQNIANLGTTRTANGEPYQGVSLVSGPRAAFGDALHTARLAKSLQGVQVYGIEPTNTPVRRVYEPAHPHADPDGFVTYPGIDHASEMTSMLKTTRSYEANLVVMNAAKSMYLKALELGGKA